MDKRIRRNELCIIGLPRCDFVFSSTRTCFIGYGFETSKLEMTILKNLLKEKNIEAIEAGSQLTPAQNAYCAKICSKIITSQFCIILLNNDHRNNEEVPNANVNMEYGLMLGFNKYIIPFQRANQRLPFNVSGLDTIKYTDQDFERKASEAIDQAVEATRQESTNPVGPDQILEAFLLMKKALVTPLDTDGDKNLYNLGRPLGFNLLNDFSGFTYIFFGNFTFLRTEAVVWRLRTLKEILEGRRSSIESRLKLKIATPEQAALMDDLLGRVQIWVVVTSADDKARIKEALKRTNLAPQLNVYSLQDIESEVLKLTGVDKNTLPHWEEAR